ncbi:MAG: hypothetical protein HY744_21590, partial [Deltaproteobacteria bacterium]|nr:hypothetical protein [Deltaproteobacteria bacterium]
MAEEQDSSVLFSLKELMNIEEDRIRSEDDERHRTAAAAEQARIEAERRAREEEEARIRAEQERRRTEEQRAREEAARLDAMRQAEIERARTEAEQQARIQAMAAQQAHERELAMIKSDKTRRRMRLALVAGSLIVVLGIGLGGWKAYTWHQETQMREAATRDALERAKKQAEEARRQQEESERKIAELMKNLDSAKDESERARIREALAA